MIIIFGLGNPGRKFIGTRHNLGQEVVNLLRKKWVFSGWQKIVKLRTEISNKEFADKEILLVKSLTFMNQSGKAIKKISFKFQVPISKIYVVHDDIDLPLGKIKISRARGSAGHKGIESIMKELGTKDLIRFRIGIKKQRTRVKKREVFVLQRFPKDEKQLVEQGINKTIQAIELTVKYGLEKAMQEFNKD